MWASQVWVLLWLAVVWWALPSQARRKRDRGSFRFADCGNPESRLVRFLEVRAHPMPIVVPGTLHVSLAGNVSEELPRRLSLRLSITKYFFGIPFHIPCIDGTLGSCTFDNICARLERYETSRCPRSLRQHNVRCHCPFLAGSFSMARVPVNVPKINGFAGALINGDYEMALRIMDEDEIELGCLEIKFSMKKRHRGWLFKI